MVDASPSKTTGSERFKENAETSKALVDAWLQAEKDQLVLLGEEIDGSSVQRPAMYAEAVPAVDTEQG